MFSTSVYMLNTCPWIIIYMKSKRLKIIFLIRSARNTGREEDVNEIKDYTGKLIIMWQSTRPNLNKIEERVLPCYAADQGISIAQRLIVQKAAIHFIRGETLQDTVKKTNEQFQMNFHYMMRKDVEAMKNQRVSFLNWSKNTSKMHITASCKKSSF